MKRKSLLFLALTLALATVMNLFAGIAVFADDATTTDVIEIDSADELKKIGQDDAYPLNGNYLLTSDIDLSVNGEKTEWTPIGDSSTNAFTGVFDGNGHTISNFTLTSPTGTSTDINKNLAFFGYVDGGVVKYVTFANATLSVETPSIRNNAIVVGTLNGGAKISHCKVEDSVTIESTSGITTTGNYFSIAAFVGFANNGSNVIEYCVNNADIRVTGITGVFRIAGIVADCATIQIKYCVNNGQVSVTEAKSAWQRVGGILGSCATWGSRSMENCINNGDITFTCASTISTDDYIAGGIFGSMPSGKSATMNNCFNFGVVSAGGARFGQISGYGRTINMDVTNYGVKDLGPVDGVKYAADTDATWGDVSKTADELKAMPEYQAIVAEVNEHLTGVTTDFVGYQTTTVDSNDRFNMRLVATITGDYTKCQNVGFKVTVNNLDEEATTTALYRSITATENGEETATEYSAADLGGDYIFVLVCKGLPANTTLNFTVTTFYTAANGEVVSETETFTATVPGDTLPELAA